MSHTQKRLLFIVSLGLVASLLLGTSTPRLRALPSGALKIVMLGDSLTEGDGDDEGKGGYPARLQALLEPIRAGTKIINLGKSGWDSSALINGDQGLPSQLETAIAEKPDIATVWIGSNDLWYSVYGSSDDEVLTNYQANIELILSKLSKTKAVLFIALLDDQTKRPYARKTDSGYSADDLKRMSMFAIKFNEIIRDQARRYGAITVDFFKTTLFTDNATLAEDGNHPNAAGYDKIAKIWFGALEPVITGKQAAPTPDASTATAVATSKP